MAHTLSLSFPVAGPDSLSPRARTPGPYSAPPACPERLGISLQPRETERLASRFVWRVRVEPTRPRPLSRPGESAHYLPAMPARPWGKVSPGF